MNMKQHDRNALRGKSHYTPLKKRKIFSLKKLYLEVVFKQELVTEVTELITCSQHLIGI